MSTAKDKLIALLKKHIEEAKEVEAEKRKKEKLTQELISNIKLWSKPLEADDLIKVQESSQVVNANNYRITTFKIRTAKGSKLQIVIFENEFDAKILNKVNHETSLCLKEECDWVDWVLPSGQLLTQDSFYEFLCNELE
jgi:hypothetical protein